MTSKDLLYVENVNLPNTCTPDEFSLDNNIGIEDVTERISLQIFID